MTSTATKAGKPKANQSKEESVIGSRVNLVMKWLQRGRILICDILAGAEQHRSSDHLQTLEYEMQSIIDPSGPRAFSSL